MMNIADEVKFNTFKPTIVSIKKTAALNVFVVGLLKDQTLPEHKTQVPALLIVLQGELLFSLNGVKTKFKKFDTYQIPIDVGHHVVGLGDENIFLIVKENKQADAG